MRTLHPGRAVEPGGRLLARTRKVHIPAFPYYHEDHYFAPGNTGSNWPRNDLARDVAVPPAKLEAFAPPV